MRRFVRMADAAPPTDANHAPAPAPEIDPDAARAALAAERDARVRACSAAISAALDKHRCRFLVNLVADWDMATGTTTHRPVIGLEIVD